MQNPTDDDHRVGSEDVHHDACAKLGEIVGSYDGVTVAWQEEVEPRLVLDEIVDARTVLERPLHLGDQPRQSKALRGTGLEDLLDQCQHRVLVEVPAAKVGVLPDAHLELMLALGRGRIDPDILKALKVVLPQSRINDMKCALVPLDALLNEGEKHAVALIRRPKERAHVP